MRLSTILTAAVLAGTASCASGNDSAGGAGPPEDAYVVAAPQTASPADVSIDTARPPPAPSWTIDSKPSLSLGEVGGPSDELFVQIRDAALLPDGGLVVLDAGAPDLRFFNADGSLRATAGRAGGGPGEFRGPFKVEVLPGDTVAVWDFSRKVFTYWSLNGDLITERPADHHTTIHEGELLPNGWLAVPRYDSANPPARGQYRQAAELILYAAGDTSSLGAFPYVEMFAGLRDGTPMPFAAKSSFAGGGTPLRMVVGDDSHVPKVRIYNHKGEFVEEMALHDTRRALTSAMWDDLVDTARRDFGGGPEFERKVAAWSRPDSTPAFDQLKIDTLGRLWVLRKEDPGVHAAVHTNGMLAADLQLPDLIEIFEIGADYIIGLHRDELGVQTIQLFRYTSR